MVSRAQLIRAEAEVLGDGPPITIPAFADRRGVVRHFFGTRPRRPSAKGSGSPNGTPADVPAPRDSGAPRATGRGALTAISVKQVHGTDVLVLDRPVGPEDTFPGGWDALVTDQPGLLLTVRTADCVPLLLHDAERRAVAAVHAGWRGALAGIVRRTIETMHARFGSAPASLELGIGPSVGPCCYEVDTPVLATLKERCPDWQRMISETGPSTAMLDLRALVRCQAERGGVHPNRIRAVRVCTVCHPGLFYSYRREGVVQGTMVSGIMLVPGR